MTLELSRLTEQVRAMGEDLATRERQHSDMVALARRWLTQYVDQGERLRHPARAVRAAIPTDEPLDGVHPLPAIPERYTVIAADGSQIQPDPHGAALYYLLNVGSLVYRHGSGQAPEAHSEPTLRYTEDDLYENRRPVAGNLLDLRRDLAEITRLAGLCAAEPRVPTGSGESGRTVALVDGTLVLWVLEDRSEDWKRAKVMAYLDQLQRIRESGAAVAAFTSRPRRAEVTRLLHLASLEGETNRAAEEPNPLERLPDRAVFDMLPPGARSALFVSPAPINHDYYQPAGHTVQFCYLNLAEEGRDPVVARIELPVWVAQDTERLALVHGAIVAQARITGDYPYALARADELAYVSGREREAFEEMVTTALLRAGVQSALSPKAYYKTLTRRGRRKHRV
ncbi:MAG: DNA double-strand break repair nuclease NurA [Anaerolineae bacterium]|nr:DNA double-strand break repair nuclease NurA [Anaerolineae bacterium]